MTFVISIFFRGEASSEDRERIDDRESMGPLIVSSLGPHIVPSRGPAAFSLQSNRRVRLVIIIVA